MSYIIGLTSMRPNGVEMVYLQSSELEHDTLFSLERSIRASVKKKPKAEWADLVVNLEKDGFTPVLHTRNNPVFIHSRPWDEHLVGPNHSFFVTFERHEPYELAGEIFLATPNPQYYSSICDDFAGANKVLIFTKENDPIYFDDLAFRDDTHAEKCPLGEVTVIREQFCCDDEFIAARKLLAASGYIVSQDQEVAA